MCKLFRLNWVEISKRFFNRRGMKIGKNCKIYSDISTTESYLVELGDDVTVSTNVTFLTHDNSICKVDDAYTDTFGKIKIGNNCFIGANVLILPGVTIADNIIIGAGSVVSKSLTDKDSVYVGNPIRRICSTKEFYNKNKKYAINISGMSKGQKKQAIENTKLIER